MSGPLIALTTVIVVFAFVWFITVGIDKLLGWFVDRFNRGGFFTKCLLLIPVLLLAVISFASGIFALICLAFGVYVFATGARSWWHKGH